MMYGRVKSAPTPTECSLLYIYAMNDPCGVFAMFIILHPTFCSVNNYATLFDVFTEFDIYEMICGLDKSAPTPTVCSLLYIYVMNRSCGMSVDIHFK